MWRTRCSPRHCPHAVPVKSACTYLAGHQSCCRFYCAWLELLLFHPSAPTISSCFWPCGASVHGLPRRKPECSEVGEALPAATLIFQEPKTDEFSSGAKAVGKAANSGACPRVRSASGNNCRTQTCCVPAAVSRDRVSCVKCKGVSGCQGYFHTEPERRLQ